MQLSWSNTSDASVDSYFVQYKLQASPAVINGQFELLEDNYVTRGVSADTLIAVAQQLTQDWITYPTSLSSTSTALLQTTLNASLFLNGQPYDFRIVAFAGSEAVYASAVASQVVTDESFVVSNLTVAALSRSATVTWSMPLVAHVQNDLLGYSLSLQLLASGANPPSTQLNYAAVTALFGAGTTQIALNCNTTGWSGPPCLIPYSTYQLSVTALRANGLSGRSSVLVFYTLAAAPESTPLVSVVAVSSHTADFSLAPVPNINGALLLITVFETALGQSVRRAASATSVVETPVAPNYDPTSTYNFSVSGLAPFTMYAFAFRLNTSFGTTSTSAPVAIATLEAAPSVLPPPSVALVTRANPGPHGQTTGYSVAWAAPIPLPGTILFYELALAADLNTPIYHGLALSKYFATLRGPIVVRAATATGTGPWSEAAVPPPPTTTITASTSSNLTVIVVVSTIGGTALLALVVMVLLFLRHRRRSALVENAELIERFVAPEVQAALRKLNNGKYVIPREIDPSCIAMLKELGSGKFGKVFKATLDEREVNGVPPYTVAVKTLIRASNSPQQRVDFLLEGAIMAQFAHEHIVHIVGQVSQGDELMIVLQHCENGCLLDYLRSQGKDAPVQILVSMGSDVADGMVYMSRLGFIHRDIAARNVLVGSDYVCKVSDFGFARKIDPQEGSTYDMSRNGTIPVRWAAVEVLEYRKFSTASDMWSFAVLLHEIFSLGAKPYSEWQNARVWTEVLDGYRLPQQVLCPDEIYAMMLRAWNHDRKQRPSFDQFAETLQHMADRLERHDASVAFSGQAQCVEPSVIITAPDMDTLGMDDTREKSTSFSASARYSVNMDVPSPLSPSSDARLSMRPSVALPRSSHVSTSTGAAAMTSSDSTAAVLPMLQSVLSEGNFSRWSPKVPRRHGSATSSQHASSSATPRPGADRLLASAQPSVEACSSSLSGLSTPAPVPRLLTLHSQQELDLSHSLDLSQSVPSQSRTLPLPPDRLSQSDGAALIRLRASMNVPAVATPRLSGTSTPDTDGGSPAKDPLRNNVIEMERLRCSTADAKEIMKMRMSSKRRRGRPSNDDAPASTAAAQRRGTYVELLGANGTPLRALDAISEPNHVYRRTLQTGAAGPIGQQPGSETSTSARLSLLVLSAVDGEPVAVMPSPQSPRLPISPVDTLPPGARSAPERHRSLNASAAQSEEGPLSALDDPLMSDPLDGVSSCCDDRLTATAAAFIDDEMEQWRLPEEGDDDVCGESGA